MERKWAFLCCEKILKADAITATRMTYTGVSVSPLAEREYLLDSFTVADAALIAVLNWAHYLAMDLTSFPAVAGFHRRAITRPAVARALSEERQLREAA